MHFNWTAKRSKKPINTKYYLLTCSYMFVIVRPLGSDNPGVYDRSIQGKYYLLLYRVTQKV